MIYEYDSIQQHGIASTLVLTSDTIVPPQYFFTVLVSDHMPMVVLIGVTTADLYGNLYRSVKLIKKILNSFRKCAKATLFKSHALKSHFTINSFSHLKLIYMYVNTHLFNLFLRLYKLIFKSTTS